MSDFVWLSSSHVLERREIARSSPGQLLFDLQAVDDMGQVKKEYITQRVAVMTKTPTPANKV